jgi:hypothetical protein
MGHCWRCGHEWSTVQALAEYRVEAFQVGFQNGRSPRAGSRVPSSAGEGGVVRDSHVHDVPEGLAGFQVGVGHFNGQRGLLAPSRVGQADCEESERTLMGATGYQHRNGGLGGEAPANGHRGRIVRSQRSPSRASLSVSFRVGMTTRHVDFAAAPRPLDSTIRNFPDWPSCKRRRVQLP